MTYTAEIADLRSPERASFIINRLASRPTAISHWQALCVDACGECAVCAAAKAAVARELTKPDARIWEVRSDDAPLAPLGILRLSRIQRGETAVLDFSFFDNRQSDKVGLIEQLIKSAFAELDLQKLIAEMPAHAFLQIRTFSKLGFGGAFGVKFGGLRYKVDAIIPTASEAVGSLVIMAREAGNARS